MKYFRLLLLILLVNTLTPQTMQAQETIRYLMDQSHVYNYEGKHRKALRLLERVLKQDSRHYQAYLQMAVVYKDLGEKVNREKAFRKAVEVAPKQPVVYERYGDFLEGNKRLTEARDLYQQGIQHNPGYADLYYHLGGVFDELKDYQKAFEALSKAIALNPTSSVYFFIRAYVNKSLNKLKAALSDFNTSIELEPKDVGGYTSRADLKMELKDYEGAIIDAQKAEQLDSVRHKNLVAEYKEDIGLAYSKEAERYETSDPVKALALARESLKWFVKKPGKEWMHTFIADVEGKHGLGEFWQPVKTRMAQAEELLKTNKAKEARDLLRPDYLRIMQTTHVVDDFFEEVFVPLYQKCEKAARK